ncbi:MAG: three-Cys-motif partner protein TcmP [Moraxellaceae bacterium]|nr:three-Cys-motif partner protein TcmP [Moraxellaceae bacterium]
MEIQSCLSDDVLGVDSGPDDQHLFGGIWTCIKLEALEKYLVAFNTALSRQNFKRIYIDAFAGTGRCEIKIDGETRSIDGSARRALGIAPAFHEFCFIELRTRKLEALRALKDEHPGKTVELIQGDANAALRTLCGRYQWRNERAVLFLDPFGMHVEWTTLEAIAKTGAIDVWYLFPYAGLYRQAAKDAGALDADKEASLTRLLGTDEWREAFYDKKRQTDLFGGDSGDERHVDHREMLDFVSERLKKLFPAVTSPKVLYQGRDAKSQGGAPLFALYFAASNPRPAAHGLATRIAKDILDTL